MSTHRQDPLPTPVRASIALAIAAVLVLAIYLIFDVPIVIAASFAVITGSAGALLAWVTVRALGPSGEHKRGVDLDDYDPDRLHQAVQRWLAANKQRDKDEAHS